MPGPVPKRSEERVRRNKDVVETTKVAGASTVTAPAEDRTWHVSAKRWFRSLKKSGQAIFYEPSDWAYAQVCGDLLSMEMQREKPRSVMISQILSMMDNLLTSEGARRRARIELMRAEQDQDDKGADVITMNPAALYE